MKTIEWLLISVGLALIIWLVRRVIRRARDLDIAISDYHQEKDAQEKLREQGLIAPADPWLDLALLYNEREEGAKKSGNQSGSADA